MRTLILGLLFAVSAPAQFDAQFERLKATLTAEQMYRFLWDMPKAGDLHHHFEYGFPMRLWLEAARSKGYLTRTKISACGDPDPLLFTTITPEMHRALPPCVHGDYGPLPDSWISAVTLDSPEKGRDEFFDHITRRLEVLEKDSDLMAGLVTKVRDLASGEHILYLETQLDPRGFRDPAGVEKVRRAVLKPGPTAVRCQVSVVRFEPNAAAQIEEAYAFVDRNRDVWVSVNLVGREQTEGGQAPKFLETYRQMRRRYYGIPLALHGGETDQPGRDVRDTMLLGARRIGHGTNLISDPDTMLLLRGGKTLIEVSLVSNLLLGYVPNVDAHPFPEYLRTGIPVCLNTDDAGAFDSNFTDEYWLAVKHFHLSWEEIRQMGVWSLEFSFAEAPLKQRLLAQYARDMSAFEAKYANPNAGRLLESVNPRISGFARRRIFS